MVLDNIDLWDYQLSVWVARKHTLIFMVKQLHKYDGKEGKEYVWKENGDGSVAIFTTGLKRI